MVGLFSVIELRSIASEIMSRWLAICDVENELRHRWMSRGKEEKVFA